MASTEIDEFQDLILRNAIKIAKSSPVDKGHLSSDMIDDLAWLARQDPELLNMTMGSFGATLGKFCSKVDINHPYLASLFVDCNVSARQLKLMRQVAGISAYLKDNSFGLVSDLLKNQFIKHKEVSKDFTNKISRPPVRLLKNPADRTAARRSKMNPKVISLSGVLESSSFAHVSSNFKSYFCGYNYEEELQSQQLMFDTFNEMQVSAYANYVLSDMEKTKKQISAQYYGFVRLRPSDAAMILAKSMGLNWKDGSKCVQVPRAVFNKDQIFWDDSGLDTLSPLKYHPNNYPLHAFSAKVPQKTAEILDLLENYPAASGKPIFDHYWVVCPSFHLDYREFGVNKHKNRWIIYVKGEKVKVDWDAESADVGEVNKASIMLDHNFVSSGFITPIVLGERNGECFFLCYWN